MKRMLRAACVLFLLLPGLFACADAATPYETYTYSYGGNMQVSPHAFLPRYKIAEFGEAGGLSEPSDIIVDPSGNILIADKGNNRILVLDGSLKLIRTIDGFRDAGGPQTFNKPQGVYVAPDKSVYVADTDNGRIVVFNADYTYERTIEQPSADILPDNFKYNPRGVSVDKAGRIYVVSQNTNMGVIALDKEGAFEGFIGAQRVKADMAALLRRAFMTEEQIKRTVDFVPLEYSNLTMDEKGFIYVTASSIDRYTLFSTVRSRSADTAYAAVRKLNPSGADVLRRNGFFPPVGDINFDAYPKKDGSGPSSITEVSLYRDGMYSLVDSEYQKIFTYDSYGNLLFAFGGEGEALGLYRRLASVAYVGDRLLALDALDGSVTVSSLTDYGQKLCGVIRLQENREFDKVIGEWQNIIRDNNNFDMAYLGIGKSLMEQGRYREAMEHFRLINNASYYSRAFKQQRQLTLEKWGMLLIAAAIAAALALIRLFARARRYNARTAEAGAPRTLRGELVYGFHVIFHPFDGFWDLKYEKRGSVRSAGIILAAAVLSFVYADVGAGYLAGGDGSASLLLSLGNILIPFTLWCLSNWCLTSLMDGKGSMKAIFISTAYALIPLILFLLPTTVLGHFLIVEEIPLLLFLRNAGMFWTGLLIFFGSLCTHEYTLGKNVAVCALTIAGIGILLFLMMVFFSLTGQMLDFLGNISNELSFRT